ncbi:rod shape-determining protein MreD [Teichococcus globiformis]
MDRAPPPLFLLLRRLDMLARTAFPAAGTALLMVLAAAPVGLPSAVPAVMLGCVFFWSMFRPAALPPPLCFLLGLLQDLLGFSPLGIGILTALLAHAAALRLRRHLVRQPFWRVWLAYGAFAAAAALLGYAMQALLGWRLPPWWAGVVQFLLCLGLYPLLAAVLTRAHRAMQRTEAL